MLSNLLRGINANTFDIKIFLLKQLGTIGLELQRLSYSVSIIGVAMDIS